MLISAIVVLGLTDPTENIEVTALLALAVAFLSASQDIVIDAYRIDVLTKCCDELENACSEENDREVVAALRFIQIMQPILIALM